jgi:hypothetical protein
MQMRALFLASFVPIAAVQAAPTVTPGQWESRIVVEDMAMPGMPPNVLAMMKGKPTVTSYCLTPQEAEADPKKMLNADKSCKLNRFNMAGGSIDAQMQCQTEQGPATMTMTGKYTVDTYDMTSRMQAGPMTMVSRVTARRLGPCK